MHNPLIYSLAGVRRPAVSPDELRERANVYRTLASLCQACLVDVENTVSFVVSRNAGPASDEFREKMNHKNSLITRLSMFNTGATGTASAFDAAADALSHGVAKMDELTVQITRTLLVASRNPVLIPVAIKHLDHTKKTLKVLERRISESFFDCFGISLPERVHYHPESEAAAVSSPSERQDPKYSGVLEPETIAAWEDSSLENKDRQKVLQALADDIAEKQGITNPPKVIVDASIDGPAHHEPDTNIIRISPEAAKSPSAFGTLGHEMGHAETHRLVQRVSSPTWPMEEALIRSGAIPDPFLSHGYTVDDILYLKEAKEMYDTSKDSYDFHPDEVHAERTRAEVSNDVTDEQIRKYIDDATS